MSLQPDSHRATDTRSADLVASDAPMAKSAPGVAAPPSSARNSLTGPGIGKPSAETVKPLTMATIIGFLSSPNPTVRRMPICIRPSRLPVMRITMSDPNTMRSTASTSITGPMAPSPSKSTSIGMPRKPTLPITATCASTAAAATLRPRAKATAVARR